MLDKLAKLKNIPEMKYLLLGKLCIVMALMSIMMQAIFDLVPCFLCLVQRYCLFVLGAFFILVHVVRRMNKARIITLFFSYVPAGVGLAAACRQLWLEYLPAHLRPACMPNIEYFMKLYGTFEGGRRYLFSSGNGCGKVDYKILGFSLAHYGAVIFAAAIITITLLLFGREIKNNLKPKPAREI